MQFFFFLFFLLICVLDGFKTWIKPFSIRLTNYAMLESLKEADNGDEHSRPKAFPSKILLPPSARWELMYRATVDYCQQHQQLTPHDYTTSFEGHDDLKLGDWVHRQKQRYEGKGQRAFLTGKQLNKLMAIDKFREWAEDPLRDDDVRWEFMYQATVDYCQQHQQLPSNEHTTSFEGHDDLNVGGWVKTQKERYNGNLGFLSLTDEQLNKLMAIDEFREWAEDPLRDDDARWEFMYQATVDYCQQHQQLPHYENTTIFDGHDNVYLGDWVTRQKQRYDGTGRFSSLNDEQLNKLMAIDAFREWAEDPLRDADVRWEFMYQRLLHGNFSGGYNLDSWFKTQKKRYKDPKRESPLSDEERTKLMASVIFRKWAENPLRDADVHWEINFDLVAEYCYFHLKLPPCDYKSVYERSDGTSQELNIGKWLTYQKTKYSGGIGKITEEQHDKLMQISEFKSYIFSRFGTTTYSNFFNVKVKKCDSKIKKSTPAKQ